MRRRGPTMIAMGASAGGIPALQTILSGFDPDINAFVCVVLHRPANVQSSLADVLERASRLPVVEPSDGQFLMVTDPDGLVIEVWQAEDGEE